MTHNESIDNDDTYQNNADEGEQEVSQDHLSIEDNSDNDGANVQYQDPMLNFQKKPEPTNSSYHMNNQQMREYKGLENVTANNEYIRQKQNKSQVEEQ